MSFELQLSRLLQHLFRHTMMMMVIISATPRARIAYDQSGQRECVCDASVVSGGLVGAEQYLPRYPVMKQENMVH